MPESSGADESTRLRDEIVRVLDDFKAREISIYDARSRSPLLDWFILATGEADKHILAMGEALNRGFKRRGARPIEGRPESGWIVLDLGDCVVHLFTESVRSRVDLDAVWNETRMELNSTHRSR